MKLVAGLGNPGIKYAGTRHNIGFLVAGELAKRHDAVFRRGWRFPGLYAKAQVRGGKVLLVKPLTFMNRSGLCLKFFVRKKKVVPQELLVVYDDVSLPLGSVRLRRGGSAGGHNGLKSVAAELETDAVPRLRVGIGMPPDGTEMIAHVLGPFAEHEQEAVKSAVIRAADAVECWLEHGMQKAMNDFN